VRISDLDCYGDVVVVVVFVSVVGAPGGASTTMYVVSSPSNCG
jgi:hypothetical protein